jgi:predicted nuclease with TOPRIM domain
MQLTPYSEIISLSKEAKEQKLAAGRVKTQRARCELEVSKLEEEVTRLEGEVSEICSKYELDIHAVGNKLDEHALAVRKLTQLRDIVSQLFPADPPAV